jgi:hypothetical protein
MENASVRSIQGRLALCAAAAFAAVLWVGAAGGLAATPRGEAGQGAGTPGPDQCLVRVEAVFWTGEDWQRLADALAADASPCVEYWISIPPRATPKTDLRRPEIFQAIRALGPQFHPMAEMTLGTNTGWGKWIESTGNSWYEAGVEFRRRMVDAGLDPAAGETWLLNEFDRSTRRDATSRDEVEKRQGLTTPPYRRADMLELLRGLHEGDGTVPVATGAVEIGINFSHQNLPDVPGYKAEMAAWLEDGPFWAEVAQSTRWLLREAYPDSRQWGVARSGREDRRQHLEDYIFHTLDLAEAGPVQARAARKFLRRAYLPLANAGWTSLGGDEFEFVTGHGRTIIPPDQMQSFISEQVYAIRHYHDTHRPRARVVRLGFSWQPFNRLGMLPEFYVAALNEITARLASSIHWAFPPGVAHPRGACGPAGARTWCRGAYVSDAAFTDAWEDFDEWPE